MPVADAGGHVTDRAPPRTDGLRLDAIFAAQAAATPARPAILWRGVVTTYAALEARANRIARHLIEHGGGPGMLVGICLDRSPELVAALLGVLKAGAAYLPLDPAYPPSWREFVLADGEAALLLTRAELIEGLALPCAVLDLDREAAAIARQDAALPLSTGGAHDLAYVIYTSGSTGRPKGVELAHSAAGLVGWLRDAFPPAQRARIAATTSICFDPSIIELFGTLGTGGLVILKADALEPFAPDERPTMLSGPPSVLGEVARAGAIPDSVRVLNVGGERLTAALVRTLYAASRCERVLNHYGPTEATTLASVEEVPLDAGGEPGIGHPVAGARITIRDEAGGEVPAGEVGEICIAGPGVALGYRNRPALTADRFRADPDRPGGRMYRTGDLGRVDGDGGLRFLGRADEQVKLRGHRIEPGAVEAALMRLPGVRQAIVLVAPDERGRERLVAYIACDDDPGLAAANRRLAADLPRAMLPSALVVLPALPLAPNGKIDRAALPAPATPAPAPEEAGIGPVEETVANSFRAALQRPDLGLDDDFFASGGDSLLALEVAIELERLLGHSVPVALLGHAATPRQLAALLAEQPAQAGRGVFPLQPEGDGPPLFCLPDLYSRPLGLIALARRLAPDRPVFGIGLAPVAEALCARPDIAAITAHGVRAIRSARPCGPYAVAAFSYCGPFAHDLACALEAEGERVLLVLIDCPAIVPPPSPARLARWAARELVRAWRAHGLRATLRQVIASRGIWQRWFLPHLPVSARELPGFVPRVDRPVAAAVIAARAGWRPRRFAGRTLLVESTPQSAMFGYADRDGALGWRRALVDPPARLRIAGRHNDIVREPLVGDIAAAVRAEMARLAVNG